MSDCAVVLQFGVAHHRALIDEEENGPFKVKQKETFALRKSTYSRTFSKII